MDNVVSEEVRRLLQAGVSSMDHVDPLLHLRERESSTVDRRDRAALDDLLTIYNSRPVTLVRAIYRANV